MLFDFFIKYPNIFYCVRSQITLLINIRVNLNYDKSQLKLNEAPINVQYFLPIKCEAKALSWDSLTRTCCNLLK